MLRIFAGYKFLLRTILPLLLLLAGAELSAAPQIRKQRIAGRTYFNFRDLMRANRIGLTSSGRYNRFFCNRFTGNITANSRKAKFNGVNVALNFAPRMYGYSPYMAMTDWQTAFRGLMYPGTLKNHPVRTITIDVGHGGDDPGAIGRYSKEKYLTLSIARKLATVLRKWGFRVRMTRNSDIKLPLAHVAKIQQQHKSDLFISIHINAAKDRSIDGIETYCLTPAGAPSTNQNKVPKQNNFPGNKRNANNFALAYHIQRGMLRRTKAVDRGVKYARFMVLRNISAPGVLVEAGFISNRAEERRLNSQAYQEKIVYGIAEGVINYCKAIK